MLNKLDALRIMVGRQLACARGAEKTTHNTKTCNSSGNNPSDVLQVFKNVICGVPS